MIERLEADRRWLAGCQREERKEKEHLSKEREKKRRVTKAVASILLKRSKQNERVLK